MAQNRVGLQQILDDAFGERFVILFIDSDRAARSDYMVTTSTPMTEVQVLEFFGNRSQPTADVESMFDRARATLRGDSDMPSRTRTMPQRYTALMADPGVQMNCP